MDNVYKVYGPAPWESPIKPQTMDAAINLGRYFEAHAKAAFALMGSNGKVPAAKKLWSVIQRHQLDNFKVSELWQKVRRRFSNVEELEAVLNTLEELGYVRRLETPKQEGRGKPPSPKFLLNPLARTLCTRCTLNSNASDHDSCGDREVEL
jgi:replicative DNA helicase